MNTRVKPVFAIFFCLAAISMGVLAALPILRPPKSSAPSMSSGRGGLEGIEEMKEWTFFFEKGTKEDALDLSFNRRIQRCQKACREGFPVSQPVPVDVFVVKALTINARDGQEVSTATVVSFDAKSRRGELRLEYGTVSDKQIVLGLTAIQATGLNPSAHPVVTEGAAAYVADVQGEEYLRVLESLDQRHDIHDFVRSFGWLAVAYAHEVKGMPLPEVVRQAEKIWTPWQNIQQGENPSRREVEERINVLKAKRKR